MRAEHQTVTGRILHSVIGASTTLHGEVHSIKKGSNDCMLTGSLDEAVNTVNSLKSELVKCTTYRRPTLPIEEKFIFLVKCCCLRVSTNLVGIIKRTKNREGVPSRCWAPTPVSIDRGSFSV